MPKTGRRRADPEVYEAVAVVVDNGLRADGSAFTPGEAVWTAQNFDALRQHFVDQPDLGGQSYLQKLEGQLAEAPDSAIQLMAELHYVHLLLPSNISGTKKRQILGSILKFMQKPASLPESLGPALEKGFINPGTFYLTRRDLQLNFLIEFGQAWKVLPQEERDRLLEDPWLFKEFTFGLPVHSAFAQREGLLHLFHTNVFEAIVSRAHKQLIAKRFADNITTPTEDIDRQLVQVREGLTAAYGNEFDFYDGRVKPLWHRGSGGAWDDFVKWAKKFYEDQLFEQDERTYKLDAVQPLDKARAALESGEEWQALLREGFLNKNNNMTDWRVRDRFLGWVDVSLESGADTAEAALSAIWSAGDVAPRIDSFLDLLPQSEIGSPNARLTIASYLLMAAAPTEYPVFRPTPYKRARDLTQTASLPDEASPSERYLATLDFLDRFVEEASSRGLEVRDRLDAQGLVWCLTMTPPREFWTKAERLAFSKWRGDVSVTDDATLETLASSLYLKPSDFLDRVVKLLEQKRQVIFHGPPGTGKTYIARELAEHLAGAEGSVELVQFHPSYSYEDFIQGYRPAEGGAGFVLRDGPLLRARDRAVESPQGTHLLIIDEINRGNLAKVFGELYYLLEYRDEELTLQYSDSPFRLPKNLWVIGTMNTSDRSIAIVDGALRRRFYFLPFFPSEPPVQGLLRRWLVEKKPAMEWIADVVDRANLLLKDRHAAIGPSHFIREDLDEGWANLVWEYAVLPYIAEQLFGEEERLPQFTISALRQSPKSEVIGNDPEPDAN